MPRGQLGRATQDGPTPSLRLAPATYASIAPTFCGPMYVVACAGLGTDRRGQYCCIYEHPCQQYVVVHERSLDRVDCRA